MNPQDTWTKRSSSGRESLNAHPNHPSSSDFNSQHQRTDFNHPFGAQVRYGVNQNQMNDPQNEQIHEPHVSNSAQNWDPTTMLNNLSFLENKIHQLQDLVHAIVNCKGQSNGLDEILIQRQQLITADLTPIIVQLISTAGSLLPSHFPESPVSQLVRFRNKAEDHSDLTGFFRPEQDFSIEDHEMKSDDEPDEGEHLSPGSYEILQLEKEEILAPHAHFCTICGKGFKRDANLRMHMRGHGDEYKTRAALAKPHREANAVPNFTKRYSCPFVGCKRNKDHKKFQPLKTILCVKNHYKRTHCDKRYACSRCNAKRFSVIADLKTHEKHCGRDKWRCSCGTTFSRKDKLFSHVALFQGHTPAIPVEECKGSVWPSNKFEELDFNGKSDGPSANACQNVTDLEGSGEDPVSYFSPLGFDTSDIGGLCEFPSTPFGDSENSFLFTLLGPCD